MSQFDLKPFNPQAKKRRKVPFQPVPIVDPNPVYTYEQMLELIHYQLERLEHLCADTRQVIPAPIMARFGTRVVSWMNFVEVCSAIGRDPDHLAQFVRSELSTSATIGSGRLMITGRYTPSQIQNLIVRYSEEFVVCSSCRSIATELVRDRRLCYKRCGGCHSSKSVPIL